MLTALGVLLGMLLALFVVARATVSIWLPALAKMLENDPKNPSKFSATTKVGPNKAKFVMKGGTVVSMLVNIAGHKQQGGPTAPRKFAIVPLAQGEIQSEEHMGVVDAYVYRHSGYRFFNPFSTRIYTYDFPRTETVMGQNGMLEVVGKTDESDYFLLAEQTYAFSITDADTGQGENVKVTLKGKVTFQIVNPFKAAFADRKWHQQAIAAIQVRGRRFARSRDFDTLLGEVAKEGDELKESIGRDLAKVNAQIESGPGTEELFGVHVRRVLIETVDMTDSEAEKSRTAKYTAERQAEVVSISAKAEAGRRKTIRAADAEAEAGYITKIAEATRVQGPIGLKLMDQKTQIGIAEKAGTVIMQVGTGQTVNPLDAAILEELKRGNSEGTAKNRPN